MIPRSSDDIIASMRDGEKRALLIPLAATAVTFGLAKFLFAMKQGQWPESFLAMWNHWDAQYYVQIAQSGYPNLPGGDPRIAFFPLFPLFIKLVALVVRDYLLAALIVSNVALAIASVFLYRLCALDRPERVALRSVFYLCVFPTAYFLHAAYSESVFLACMVSSFYFARRGDWRWAGLCGALATAARITGLALVPALLVELWLQSRGRSLNWRAVAWIGIVPLGFAAYLGINFYIFGDPLHFLGMQKLFWHKQLAPPWAGFSLALAQINSASASHAVLFGYCEIFFALLALLLGLIAAFRNRLSYGVLVLVTWLVIASNSIWQGQPRYVLTLFPIFLVLAEWGEKEIVHHLIVWASLFGYVVFLSSFLHRGWAF